MKKSPGHQQHPEHKVRETHLSEKVTVDFGGQTVAESKDVIRVDEDQHQARYYFPRSDVKMDLLEPTKTTTECPFKGTAHYFNLKEGEQRFNDAVWTYEDPYEEHRDLKGRVAFWEEKIPNLRIRAA
jgi:uncharacterized protein (DUF427 family)